LPIKAILSVGLMAKEIPLNSVFPLYSTARLSTVIMNRVLGPQK
jgi:hypothetical protein